MTYRTDNSAFLRIPALVRPLNVLHGCVHDRCVCFIRGIHDASVRNGFVRNFEGFAIGEVRVS